MRRDRPDSCHARPLITTKVFLEPCTVTGACRLLADVVQIHHEIGIKNERLFRARFSEMRAVHVLLITDLRSKAICPKIVSKQKELREDQMAKCIKAPAAVVP